MKTLLVLRHAKSSWNDPARARLTAEAIEQLTGEGPDLPTGALAQIVLPIVRWRDLKPSTRGRLMGHWRPKELP